MSLITIYGPNDDTPIFYEGLSDIIRELQNQDIILVGNLDPEKTISITCISTIPRQEIKYFFLTKVHLITVLEKKILKIFPYIHLC